MKYFKKVIKSLKSKKIKKIIENKIINKFNIFIHNKIKIELCYNLIFK